MMTQFIILLSHMLFKLAMQIYQFFLLIINKILILSKIGIITSKIRIKNSNLIQYYDFLKPKIKLFNLYAIQNCN
ncbi:unnamed protein product [Paramecium sonneborni]|uniref:Transmembrane protein n=1 Tax=Paramecium sonneborni TaxID=65129 RepID=A0A8S1MR13_9CILI|nr:unnamed protein product [Paramecium sonneborni]